MSRNDDRAGGLAPQTVSGQRRTLAPARRAGTIWAGTTRAGLVFAGLMAASGGCAVGPNYVPPTMAVPESFGEREASTEGATAAGPGDIAAWWTSLGDAMLTSLVTRAAAANNDVAGAVARLAEARANSGQAVATLFPTADGRAGYSRDYGSQNAQPGVGPIAGAPINFPGFGTRSYNLFQMGFDTSWEIDVFGGVRRGLEAAEADVAAAEADRRAVLVSVLAETAAAYVELRGLQARAGLAADNIRVQEGVVELTRVRLEGGVGSEREVQQALSLLATLQADLPPLEAGIRRQIHRLGVLVGAEPMSLAEPLAAAMAMPSMPEALAVGLPSELLRRRPDIGRAERRLAGATARVGVEVAELFPRFSLTGAFGVQSARVSNLLDPGAIFAFVGPSVRWRIFDAGRIAAAIAAADARSQAALAEYQKTVLVALEETENALSNLAQERLRQASLTRAVAADRRAVELAESRYTRGVDDFITVLDTRRNLYASQDRLVASQQALLREVIALYKALGGGWESFTTNGAPGPGLPAGEP